MGKLLLMVYGVMSLLCLIIFIAEAVEKRFHMPSKELFFFSILGGSYGTLVGMLIYHRKWKRKLFKFGIPLLIILHTALLFFIMKR